MDFARSLVPPTEQTALRFYLLEMNDLSARAEARCLSASVQSRFTPCFSSFCLALLGKLNALS